MLLLPALPVLLLALVACQAPIDTTPGPQPCNGDPALCGRSLDQVTLPGTHNSMSNADAGWLVPDQHHGIRRQLEDGVRALMLDTWMWKDQPYLCHGYCELGAEPLADGLAEVQDFLYTHPDAVIVIIFEDHVDADIMVASLEASGLADRAWTWDGGALPTLGSLIDADQRVIITTESGSKGPAWYMPAWDLFFDTPYSFSTPEDFSCELNRGSPDNPLFLVNHWISDPLPDEAAATEVNQEAVLGTRARACAAKWGRSVNFLGVDFYDVGDLFPVASGLNAQ